MSKEITGSRKAFVSNKGQSLSFPANCSHVLPMLRGHVIGAPKLNPELGKVVFDPQNNQQQFIRFSDKSVSLYFQINKIICRTIPIFGTNHCNVCYKIIFDRKANNSVEKKQCTNTEIHAVKISIPGLSITAKEANPSDENLSPFQICDLKPTQYGDTSITSTSTENPAWSPGKCLNIGKYEGRFRKKQYSATSQVISYYSK